MNVPVFLDRGIGDHSQPNISVRCARDLDSSEASRAALAIVFNDTADEVKSAGAADLCASAFKGGDAAGNELCRATAYRHADGSGHARCISGRVLPVPAVIRGC